MNSALNEQVYIYSVDTSAFYTDEENVIHKQLLKCYRYRDHLKSIDEVKKVKFRKKYINARIKKLKSKLHSLFNSNEGVRILRDDSLKDNNAISIFSSVLTRTIGAKSDELSKEVIVVRAFHYKILESLIKNGFICENVPYLYFSSSAGQIRNKKGVFIRKDTWNTYNKSLTCGLSVADINSKGGINLNKYQSYLALTSSASEEWARFDIDKTIVVDDLETKVNSLVDYIDRDTYEITRKQMDIPIEHTDGFGIFLPHLSKKAFMIRLPWVKGLLAPVDFKKFAHLNGNSVVKDIYGKEWDVEKDNIQIIFTKSQFKLWKYYENWDDYKNKFKEHKCKAARLNEEDTSNDASFNYQMLQTLTDISNEELCSISASTIKDILTIGSDKEVMLRILGATETNNNKTYLQKALSIYPELLNDEHSKQVIKDKKKSLVREAKAGKLNVNGKYTFIIPDVYAFMEYLFLGDTNPKGLLTKRQVYCPLYGEGKVDVLRSPHLYREHGIRNNIQTKSMSEWFITNGIYTSVHDDLSRLLQYDNDGDKALVIQDQTIIEVAERNMKKDDIVPLYYEMAKAEAEQITEESMYKSLILAYKANIGEISNNITKIWNDPEIDLNAIKWLCMNGNFEIDYAKTLFKPTPPDHVQKTISKYIKKKVPNFFVYAKGKEKDKVETINGSVVNALNKVIPNKRINFVKIAGIMDYKMLMKNKRIKIDEDIINAYMALDRGKKWAMRTPVDKNNGYKLYIYDQIRKQILEINSNEDYVVDTLVKYLYSNKKSLYKETLWKSFGDILYRNLKYNMQNTMQCEYCGVRINKDNAKKYCEECAQSIWKEQVKVNMREYRKRKKNVIKTKTSESLGE